MPRPDFFGPNQAGRGKGIPLLRAPESTGDGQNVIFRSTIGTRFGPTTVM